VIFEIGWVLDSFPELCNAINVNWRNDMEVRAVSFVAWSGTGKTTLVEKVIRELKLRGYRVGAVKCDSHEFEIDIPGKDSYRMAAAGADTVLITSKSKLALIKKNNDLPEIGRVLETYFRDMDIVLVEGYKMSNMPKIEIHRKELGNTLICRTGEMRTNLIGVVSNEPLDVDVPVYDIEDIAGITGFIVEKILFQRP
jgi:molybdopterin-guanine dinucleotide biosynthesis protein MobB